MSLLKTDIRNLIGDLNLNSVFNIKQTDLISFLIENSLFSWNIKNLYINKKQIIFNKIF
jgi:hypothetical protein